MGSGTKRVMYITAYKERQDNNGNTEHPSDFIEAAKVGEDGTDTRLEAFFNLYRENTEENVLKARVDYDRVDYDSRNCEHRTEMVKKKFLSLQEETLRALRREEREVSPEEKEFVVCPELECPVCLQE